MGYNLATKKMKKTTLVLMLLVAFFSVGNMTTYGCNNSTKAKLSFDVNSSFFVTAELRNDEYNQVLCLYSDGSCVIRSGNNRGTGTYNINSGRIYITWDNGTKQQGSAIFDDNQLRSVTIEGVTYSRRLVKNRQ